MSKNFEKEYKEYLNAQAPDIWDRIEAGVDALEKKSKKAQKKRRTRYQHYRMIASVAACLFALVIIVPVYLLARQDRKSETATDSAPQMVENVTIENLVVDASESEAVVEEASDGTTEIAITEETPTEDPVMFAEGTEQKGSDAGEPDAEAPAGNGESGAQIAGQEMPDEDGTISNMLQGGDDGQRKEMTVSILGEGVIQEGGMMYTAAEHGSEASTTVSLFVPEGSEIVLAADGVYAVSAKISEDGLYYTVESATLQ